jgi:hypothetical protein
LNAGGQEKDKRNVAFGQKARRKRKVAAEEWVRAEKKNRKDKKEFAQGAIDIHCELWWSN